MADKQEIPLLEREVFALSKHECWSSLLSYYENKLALIYREIESCPLEGSGLYRIVELRGKAQEIRELLTLSTRLEMRIRRQSKEE